MHLELLLFFVLIFVFDFEAAGYGIQLIAYSEPANLCDLCGSGGLGIDIRDGAGETSQSAFGGGVFDPFFFNEQDTNGIAKIALRRWDLANGKELKPVPLLRSEGLSVQVSPLGS